MIRRLEILLCVLGCLAAVPSAASAARRSTAPPPLSADSARAPISSTYGSGVFGQWTTDSAGLAAYDYTLNELTSPYAPQDELAGSTDAYHQVGNDFVHADAFNHGYVQLWSGERDYQWANYYQASSQHFAGGYGYLNVDGHAYSTLYDDRAAGAPGQRRFGTGYFQTQVTEGGVGVLQRVYAPFGDDPLMLHDVSLTNTTAAVEHVSWFEYWDVNPYEPGGHLFRGLGLPSYLAASQTLSVPQLPAANDTDPLSFFATQLSGPPTADYDTSTSAFFGVSSPLGPGGSRAAPAAVLADHLSNSVAPPAAEGPVPGSTMFALRTPLTLAPGQTISLRYAYGAAHAAQIGALVRKYRATSDPFTSTVQGWRSYVPQANFGPHYAWLSRELQWDAYMLRSDATYEDCAGEHILSQAGYYQYAMGFQGAFRDPLQFALPMIYSDPQLAREVIRYSAQEQPEVDGQVPYAIIPACQRFDLGTSDDLDLWLLMTAAEYGLATRDTQFLNTPVGFEGGGSATLWQHLKLAFTHQESQRSPTGLYLTGATGDWSDFSTEFNQMTQSTLVATQTAYAYPRLAELAELYGDHAFAQTLRSTAAGLRAAVAAQWVPSGWYSRGYTASGQLGRGVIFEEPQPWAILAGIPSPRQDATLLGNIHRYLDGYGAPGGPSRIGTAQAPANDDPGVTEREGDPSSGVGDNHAVYVGGVWYSLNGSMTWALGSLKGTVPGAVQDAWSELTANTLANHTTVYPQHWDGVISVDDACRAWYSSTPQDCGVGLSTAYDTQIMHQPAWTLFDTIKLAGINPVEDGYEITPELPMSTFSLRFPQVGVASQPRLLRGYIAPQTGGKLTMHVEAPPDSNHDKLQAYANGRSVPSRTAGGLTSFTLLTSGNRPANWALKALVKRRPAYKRPQHRRVASRHPAFTG